MQTHTELEHLERRKRSTDEQPPAARDSRAHVLALQRSAGNAAVGRMLSESRGRSAPAPTPAPAPAASSMDTRTETQSFAFNAAIRIGEPEQRTPRQVALGADNDMPRDHPVHEELPAIEAVAGEPLAATTMAAPQARSRRGARPRPGAAPPTEGEAPATTGGPSRRRRSRCRTSRSANSRTSSSATRSRRGSRTPARSAQGGAHAERVRGHATRADGGHRHHRAQVAGGRLVVRQRDDHAVDPVAGARGHGPERARSTSAARSIPRSRPRTGRRS